MKSNIDPETLHKQVQAGLDRLYTYQHDDGGWGWWQTDDSHAFMTAYVLAGLSQAKAAGFDVKQDAIDKGARVAAAGVQQVDEGAHRPARLHGVRAGAERQRLQRAVLDSVWDAALDADRLRHRRCSAWRCCR